MMGQLLGDDLPGPQLASLTCDRLIPRSGPCWSQAHPLTPLSLKLFFSSKVQLRSINPMKPYLVTTTATDFLGPQRRVPPSPPGETPIHSLKPSPQQPAPGRLSPLFPKWREV